MAMPLFYSPDYVLSEHEFDTTRKSRWIVESLASDPIAGVTVEAPTLLTEADLLLAHTPEYVEAVKSGRPLDLAMSSGFDWDFGLWTMVRATNGGAVDAALRALATGGNAGSLSSGLHHAKPGQGEGFCTFNGLAIAAKRALAAGARRVLIIDLDAHCGGGTAAILRNEPRVNHLDIAVSPYDYYVPNERFTLDNIPYAPTYLPTLDFRLSQLDPADFDLVIYNAGMDPYEHCDIGGRIGMTATVIARREAAVFGWAAGRVPVAFVIAGGYTGKQMPESHLVALHRLTIKAAVGA